MIVKLIIGVLFFAVFLIMLPGIIDEIRTRNHNIDEDDE